MIFHFFRPKETCGKFWIVAHHKDKNLTEIKHSMQGQFNSLDMKSCDDVIGSYDCISSSLCGSLGRFSSMPGSVSSVLSSALESALTFSAPEHDTQRRDVPVAMSDVNHYGDNMKHGQSDLGLTNVNCATQLLCTKPVDFAWLRERGGGDDRLVLEVLCTFFEQGQCHLNVMQRSREEMDTAKLLFHAVNCWVLSLDTSIF
jgi:hypothetical protein